MEKPLKLFLDQMKSKKFQREDEGIDIHLLSDGVIIKLIRVLICLAVGIEVIDKMNPSVKCFPIGRTWKKSQTSGDSIFYIRDYNYQQFLNVYCETAISDFTKYNAYQAWKETCPSPAGNGTKCSANLEMKHIPSVANCTREGPESVMAILRSKKTSLRDVFSYIFVSITNTDKLYDCRPRTLYYYLMSWTILIYAVIVMLGPTTWNFLFGRKIAERIRHIKEFLDTINSQDEAKKNEMIQILRKQSSKWNKGSMMCFAIFKTVATLIVTLIFIALFIRGFRADIGNLAFTVCKVHDYEYAKCASARVGLITFVWNFSVMVLGLIFILCISNLFSLLKPGRRHTFLANLFKDHDVFGQKGEKGSCCVTSCCSDLVLMSIFCERNRSLFGKGWRRFVKKKLSLKARLGFRNARSNFDSVRFTVAENDAVSLQKRLNVKFNPDEATSSV